MLVALLRSARIALLVAFATTQVGCVAIKEVRTGRDVECGAAPEAVCVRAVEFAESRLADDLNGFSDLVTVAVNAHDCSDGGLPRPRGVLRCWDVVFERADGSGIGMTLFEKLDGTLSDSG